jgi:hypothetical protein
MAFMDRWQVVMCKSMHKILVLSLVEGLFKLLMPVSDPEFYLVEEKFCNSQLWRINPK